MANSKPRVVIAGLRGGSGKTTLSLGLIAAWRQRGGEVVPFKKGPDYIDAGWLTLAAGQPCYNLDQYMMSGEQILDSFRQHTQKAQGAVIEGNRGLFDGMDADGSYSTAELAKLLQAPVILVVGDKDSNPLIVVAARRCAAKMKELGMDYEYIEVPGGTHSSAGRENIDKVFEFLSRQKKQAN